LCRYNEKTYNKLKKIDKIRIALRRKSADALLVTQPQNRRYLSGYTASDLTISESSGVLIVPVRSAPLLLTDSRYLLQAEREVSGCEVMLLKGSMVQGLKTVLERLAINKLAFESHYLLHSAAVKLMALGKKLNTEMIPTANMVERLRSIKTQEEIAIIRASVLLNEEVFQAVYRNLKPGRTERDVASEIETTMVKKGAEEPAFPTIVAAGPNAALPHAVPTDRAIKEGETVIIDMGLKLNGYCSDMTRTVILGTPPPRAAEIIRLVRRAQLAATKAIKGGILARDADRAARAVIADGGYGKNFGHGLGHGVGLAPHEAPSLNKRRRNKLQSGMVVTIEPGIYLPGWGGVRLENMAVIEQNGCTVLNKDTTFLTI
jgi:Xaa-Pro aminopeptidase